MEEIDVLEKKNPQTTVFRQAVNYNSRKKITSSTTREELIVRFNNCWGLFKKNLPQFKCYDESWLFSQIFNNISRFCDSEEKAHLFSILKKRYNIEHIVLKPPRTRRVLQIKTSTSRRKYLKKTLMKGDEKDVQTLDETKGVSGLDFSYLTTTYGVVLGNDNLLKEILIQLRV